VRLRSILLPARGDTVIDQRRFGIDSAVIGFPIRRNLRIPPLYFASTRGQEEKRGNIEGTSKVLDLKLKSALSVECEIYILCIRLYEYICGCKATLADCTLLFLWLVKRGRSVLAKSSRRQVSQTILLNRTDRMNCNHHYRFSCHSMKLQN